MLHPVGYLAILGLFFVLWLVGGGPTNPISFSGPYLNPITGPGQTAQPYGDASQYGSVNGTIGVNPSGVSFFGNGSSKDASPHAGSVTVSRNISGTSASDPKSEYVTIAYSSRSGTSLSTAGWKLVSPSGSASFPQGADVPQSGRVNTLTPITLAPGDQAIIVTGRSPIGISFRENQCTGYLEENQDFRPALTQSCPTAWEEYDRRFDGNDEVCRRFVQTVPYCSSETDLPDNASRACHAFAEEYLDYNGCVAAHRNEDRFRSSTWRIFLGKSEELWPRSNGTITLLDADGKVIDSLSY